MNHKIPKIGLLLLSAKWFKQIGASQGSFRNLSSLIEQDAADIVNVLSAQMNVVCPGVLTTREEVRAVTQKFLQEGIDLLVACQITWGEDRLIKDAIEQLPSFPLLLWCYSPYQRLPDVMSMTDLLRGSGPVGAVQASGSLKRLGKTFGVAYGSYHNLETINKIYSYAKAAQVIRDLRTITIGILPNRCDQMTGTYVDEFKLATELGPVLKYITTYDYRTVCEQIPADRVAAFIEQARVLYQFAPSVTEMGIERSARASLGLAKLCENDQLDAIAIEDVGEEMHRMIGVRPGLYVPELFDRAVVSMEADICGAMALWILKKLSGQAPMFTEIFMADEVDNCLLLGHAGVHDLQLVENRCDVLIEPDGEYLESEPDSAWMSFRAKGGIVTLFSIFYDTDHFKFIIFHGEALAGERKLLGSPHIYVKMATPLALFFEKSMRTGMTHHWSIVHADVIDQLVYLAELLCLELVII